MSRAREHPNALTAFEPKARLSLKDLAVFAELLLGLGNRPGRYPELVDLDSAFALILRSVLKPEKLRRAADMVIVEMREGDNIERASTRLLKIRSKFIGQLGAFVGRIIGISHVG